MSPQETASALPSFETVQALRLEALTLELTKRVRVVNEDALQHLIDRGVLARMAADGCCKPDGGTCCPNARRVIDRTGDLGRGG